MAEIDPETFRQRFRMEILERLVLLTAFHGPVLSGALTADESQQALDAWLDRASADADRQIGARFGEASMTALYAEEIREMTARMKEIVARLAAAAKGP